MKDCKYDKVLTDGIENFEKKIEDYASWIINGGLRFQKGWALSIDCPVTCPDVARACVKIAYQQGARDVSIFWTDPYTTREKYANSEVEYLGNEGIWPDIARDRYEGKDMAFIIFLCGNQDMMADLPREKQFKSGEAQNKNFASFKRGLEIPYTICGASNREWAQKVYPDLPIDEAYIKVWQNLFEIARIDGQSDPVQNWFDHCDEMKSNADKLNKFHFNSLHFTSEYGTDCTFKLPKKHKWMATAVNTSATGLKFSANMPTEEVFCVPEKTGVNGTIVSKKAMPTKTGVIVNPHFEIKNGEIVDFGAEEGKDLLADILNSDANGKFLGEVAIVPYDTPISRQGITYYNILFDENSGCHTAIGNAYSKCIEGGLQMTDEELANEGLNICSFHEDCIFGSPEMKIVGTTEAGENITIFKHGAWTI